MNQPLRVAVVGAGGWGRQHTRAFAARDDVTVVAVAARRLSTAKERADSIGAVGYNDLAEMMRRECPDLVSVCLPNTEHFEPTRELLAHKVPLLVEKPLVFEVEQGRELIARAATDGTFFAINFNHRYAEPVQRTHAAIADGRLGELTFLTWRFGGEGGAESGPHGNLVETQCHGFDMLEHLGGPIAAVTAEFTDRPDRGHSTVALALRFASGAVGTLVGSYDTSYAYPDTHRLEIDGTGGRAVVVDTVKRWELSRRGDPTRTVWEAGYFDDESRMFHATFDRYLGSMLAALRDGQSPPVPATAGLRALELAWAAIESFQTGRRVDVIPG